jgi:LysM repeat protein
MSAPQVEALEREKPKPAPVTKKKAPPVRTPAAKTDSRIYVVKRGDTLSGIAKRYPGVSVKDIMRHNHVGENIRAGQKLEIPKP